jgi:myo-inositol-1(or 4)-monophosphatase
LQASDAAEDLALIGAAAREAGAIALGFFGKDPEVWMKTGSSPVSEADLAVDRFLHDVLRAARPDYGWLSEETADSGERLSARRTFVVDPIDGTRAFIEKRSTWCVSIAVVEAGRPLAGVLDCPVKDEVFLAALGGGGTVNGAPLALRRAERPVLAGPRPLLDEAARRLSLDFDRTGYIPSLAYRIAMVARGEIDATFVKPNAHDWDLAAADLILAETGGQILDASGAALSYAGPTVRHGALVAGSAPLLPRLRTVIAPV